MESSNTTTIPSLEDCGISERVKDTVIPILYLLLFPFALLLNVLVAWISIHLNSKSTFMIYLKNLVAADLLMTLTFPIKAVTEMRGASLELKMLFCRFSQVFFYSGLNVSVTLMGLISLDRFFKIVTPGRTALAQNLVFGRAVSAFIWIMILCSNTLPTMILTNQDPANKTGELCIRMKSDSGLKLHEGVIIFSKVLFWAVCAVVVFCYFCITKRVLESYKNSKSNNERGKREVKFRVFVILLVFLVCYVPYHSVRIPYTKLQVEKNVTCLQVSLEVAKHLTLFLACTNVCLDPLIYFFLCRPFRKRFYEITGLQKPPDSESKQSEDDNQASEN
ncbi:P2Y purinoceptor 13-like [Chanos chanos]|uniref:P2Y purinoceptor 13-like n=1 Tax=Chanos chanos TaxID=29144 RepID=A0A6J2VP86_CHACN|nr:P2Y purinoceptor 13-like [Chanos chanos]